MTKTPDFERITSEAHQNADRRFPDGIHRYTYESVTYSALLGLREVSPSMVDAMIQTPWPEGMSAQDQMQAMFRSAIDAVLGPYAPADSSSPGQG